MGWGTYSPAGLVLVAASGAICAIAIRSSRSARLSISHSASPSRLWLPLLTVIAAFLVLALYAVRVTPAEQTDVYLFQRDAAAAFVHGTDPYTITHQDIFGEQSSYFYPRGLYSNGRVHIGFAYPPLALLMILPGYLLGDLRYSGIAALVISVLLLVRIRMDKFVLLVIAILLLSPTTFYVLSRGFSEPLMLLTLALTLYAADRRSRWLFLALAAFLSSKQYSLLALPFAFVLIPNCDWKQYARLLMLALGTSLILCAPFAIWNFRHFWNDLVVLSFIVPFRPESLSFSVLAAKLRWGPLPPALPIVAVLSACFWCLAKARREPSMFACCFAFLFLVLLALHKQAFVNYYFLVVGAMLQAAIAAKPVAAPFSTIAVNYNRTASDLDVTAS